MEVNKNQAIYKWLPGAWAVYQEKNKHYTVLVEAWNTQKVTNIYKPKIVKSIQRQIEHFELRGGDITEFKRENIENLFEMYEAAMNPNIADIYCNIEPKFFYCHTCGETKQMFDKVSEAPICNHCKKRMNQLQFVYACECGFTKGIRSPATLKDQQVLYRPSSSSTDKSTYHFLYKEGQNLKQKEMAEKCPSCGAYLRPQNASDKRNFIPFSIKAVNLINEKMGDFLNIGEKAQKSLIANWLGYIDNEGLKDIIDHTQEYLEEKDDEEQIKKIMGKVGCDREMAIRILNMNKEEHGNININEVCNKIDIDIIENNNQNIEIISSTLLEYFTLLNSNKIITLEEAKENAIMTENILESQEIDEINKKAGIKHAQLSADIEIINATYGYTRRASDPNNIREQLKNKNLKLKLKSFYNEGKYKIYTAKLDTEGILIEFDRKKIMQWLIDNDVIKDDIDLEDEQLLKRWFLNNVDMSLINNFGIISADNSSKSIITKYVYELLHTISHMLIKSAGVYSGLDKDSLAEMIFANIPAIYIYSTTIQGITLGALSGLFEQSYKTFIENAINESKICIFDPICYESQNGRCIGCTYISDTSCISFNNGLSRIYLYGGNIKINESQEIVIRKGFWQ